MSKLKKEVKIELSSDEIRKIVLKYIKKKKGVKGELKFNLKEISRGGGDVFWTDTVFKGATFKSK